MRFWLSFAVLALLWPLSSPAAATSACPGRIVSLGGDITEIVYALGAGDCVVAADTTSTYPAAAERLPKVGYLRALNAEGVIALRPDLVLASAEAGPPQVVDQLRRAGVRVESVAESHTAAGVIAKIEIVAEVLDRPRRGTGLIDRVRSDLCELRERLAHVDRRARVLFYLTMASRSPLAAGRDTAAAGIIGLAGGVNAIDQFDGYKPLSAEALVKLAPDVIVVMSEGAGARQRVLAAPGVALTPAGRHERIIAMSGAWLLGFGPRFAEAAEALALKLYPALARQPSNGDGRNCR